MLYLSPLYELTLRSALAGAVAGVVLTTAGCGYFWTLSPFLKLTP